MKKFKLNFQCIEGIEVLSREEMKNVKGGETPPGGSNCSGPCPCADNCFCSTTVSDTKVCVVASA